MAFYTQDTVAVTVLKAVSPRYNHTSWRETLTCLVNLKAVGHTVIRHISLLLSLSLSPSLSLTHTHTHTHTHAHTQGVRGESLSEWHVSCSSSLSRPRSELTHDTACRLHVFFVLQQGAGFQEAERRQCIQHLYSPQSPQHSLWIPGDPSPCLWPWIQVGYSVSIVCITISVWTMIDSKNLCLGPSVQEKKINLTASP